MGIQSDVRTSSGMFLSPDDSTYPIVRVWKCHSLHSYLLSGLCECNLKCYWLMTIPNMVKNAWFKEVFVVPPMEGFWNSCGLSNSLCLFLQAIEKRISVYSQVPVENGELIQSQFYKPHHDYFSDSFNLKRGGQRVATMLIYLSDNVEGGETYFPMAGSGFCRCGGKSVRGLSVAPVKGNAVLFWSMGLDGQSDPNSIHGGCEVLAGEKWSATKWMRQRSTH
ncbi:Prolyl 4-hydroxylase 1 [Vitis vinifera]|uniref:Prolyl 4-hydroxylase 1 n=1 Tax=Vitis vinifera TaxID=29760 RepID=A0A438HDM3_VITVI|nr:Prolyl 4-hydroxylase 1 [Vitis vinifera]